MNYLSFKVNKNVKNEEHYVFLSGLRIPNTSFFANL